MSRVTSVLLQVTGFGQNGTERASLSAEWVSTQPNPSSVAIKAGTRRTRSMREVTITAVRYNPILGRQVVVRLTYNVSEGPRPGIVRWFLVREEMLKLQDGQDLSVERTQPAERTW
jgi:hypothetical protein